MAAKDEYTKLQKKVVNTANKGALDTINKAKSGILEAKSEVNAQTAQGAKQAYNLYNQAKRDLASNLPTMSETTKSKLGVNYSGARATGEAAKQSARDTLTNAYRNIKTSTKTNYFSTKGNAGNELGRARIARNDTLKQNKQNRADTQKANKLNVYKNTISRFDTLAKCDKAIKSLRKGSDPLKKEKIAYIQKQRANLKAAMKQEAAQIYADQNSGSSGGSGRRGYGRSYYRRSYGGGGSSSAVEYTGDVTTKEAKKESKPEKKSSKKSKGNSAAREWLKSFRIPLDRVNYGHRVNMSSRHSRQANTLGSKRSK